MKKKKRKKDMIDNSFYSQIIENNLYRNCHMVILYDDNHIFCNLLTQKRSPFFLFIFNSGNDVGVRVIKFDIF